MGSHPINLGIRFLLELACWGSLGYWGWTQHTGGWRFAVGLGLPLIAMALWGTFRVPGDPGKAPVAISGALRLVLEMVEFGAAFILLGVAGRPAWGIILAVVVLVHYALSYDRIRWLIARN